MSPPADQDVLSFEDRFEDYVTATHPHCGYRGDMGLMETRTEVPWYFSWPVLIGLILTGIGFIPALILGMLRGANKKRVRDLFCPHCETAFELTRKKIRQQRQQHETASADQTRVKTQAVVLAVVAGWCGLHWLKLNQTKRFAIYLILCLTVVGLAITLPLSLIDAVRLGWMDPKVIRERYLEEG